MNNCTIPSVTNRTFRCHSFYRIFFFLFLLASIPVFSQEKLAVIIDADTGNEVDDPFALARALLEPSWDILALNATQWQASHWAEPQSMENSHRLNQVLLGHMGLSVKTRRGGAARMYDWGDLAQHSAAAYEIIQQAKKMPVDEKLTVIALGALTNVASAIYIEPAIESRIRLYWLGSVYNFEEDILSKVDFNCVMDIRALDILLQSTVEMHIMPLNVAEKMTFTFAETSEQFAGKHELGDFLLDRWNHHLDGGRKERVIWDLALIEAMINPQWALSKAITTSKENGQREIRFYQSIDVEKMKATFFETLLSFSNK